MRPAGNPCQRAKMRSIFVAMMTSFSCRPPIFFVCNEIVA